MKIVVIDGQGGGVGKCVIESIKSNIKDVEIIAVGTNSLATSAMLKAGAGCGATGENSIIYSSSKADIIVGPMGIILADAILGEITPAMAIAISKSDAMKVLIPVSKCHARIAGLPDKALSYYIDDAIKIIKELCQNK